MEKNIVINYSGVDANVGKFLVSRLLPNRYLDAVGPFVFLDHLYPFKYTPSKPELPNGSFAHPHRGIATFSYVFHGELEHFDSKGNHGIVREGGAQWMKAGNGIIHDEHPSLAFQENGGVLHSLQFWINLPAAAKAEPPAYLAVQPEEIPEVNEGEGVKLRVVIGKFKNKTSPVPTSSQQFMFHLKLKPDTTWSYEGVKGFEYAAFLANGNANIQGKEYQTHELVAFSEEDGSMVFANHNDTEIDVILFGGEKYVETIVAEGPFVMNSHKEIIQAYNDFFQKKYGEINYSQHLKK